MEEADEAPASPGEQTKRVAKPSNPDLSDQIERAVEREPFDCVKCARVFGNFYRCNWWSPFPQKIDPSGTRQPAFGWSTATTHRVRKSTLLIASNDANGKLMIQIVTRITA